VGGERMALYVCGGRGWHCMCVGGGDIIMGEAGGAIMMW